ncbi:hypothetical protein JHK86_037988 [Glycine max]|nr:hypothetical protein JHK86_037988 [Glycine max]
MSARIQSPTSPFFMGSNDDQLERAQARAARASAIRRKSLAANFHPQPPHSLPCLNKHQIIFLCSLLSKLVGIFSSASCTLEAGVTIYSLRVDSVHSEAYKVLARMNRACQDTEQDTTLGNVNAESGQASRKEVGKKKGLSIQSCPNMDDLAIYAYLMMMPLSPKQFRSASLNYIFTSRNRKYFD